MRQTVGLLILATACTGTLDNDAPIDQRFIEVVVTDGAAPQADVHVMFQGADDTLFEEVVTGADGRATSEMAVGNVTVIRAYPMVKPPQVQRRNEVFTYIGVKAGDKLHVGRQAADPETGTDSAVLVRVPEIDGQANNYTIETPCGSGSGTAPTVALVVRNCPSQVVYYVSDGTASFVKLAPNAPNVDLSLEMLRDSIGSTLSVRNPPANTSVTMEKRVMLNGYEITSTNRQRVEATAANVELPNLPGVEQLLITELSLDGRTQVFADHDVYDSGSTVLDLATVETIPYVTQSSFMPGTVMWTEEGTGTSDVVVARLSVTRDSNTQGIQNEYTRTIIAPHAGTSLRIPSLPGVGVLYTPGEKDNVNVALGIARVRGGYEAIRGQAFKWASVLDAAPMSGQVVLSYSGEMPTIEQ